MIIGSLFPLRLGSVMSGGGVLVHNDGADTEILVQPFLVVREASQEEFIAYNQSIGEPITDQDREMMSRTTARFYEITSD